jgi:rhamnulose-1-phosphate aldolase
VELAEATIKAIDQIDVLNKAALIYIASKNMGFEPEGMSDAQMQELTETFNLPK